MKYVLEWVVSLAQFALSFYGFWLVWRVLLPHLPGPASREERVAPYVGYFTDPFVVPVAKALRVPDRFVALVALVVLAGVSVALGRVPSLAE